MRNAQRFTKNLGDDVVAEGTVLHAEDGNAYAFVKQAPDENFLHVVPFGNQYISGHGDVTKEDCGDFKSAYHNALDHVRIKRFTCHLQSCPRCFRIWARRQAASAAGYLWAFVEGDKERGIKRHVLGHWTFSPENDWDSVLLNSLSASAQDDLAERVFLWMDKDVKRLINKFSSWNDEVVSIVQHPRRKRCPKCKSAIADNKSYCIPCGMPAEWVFSPHLHVVTSFRYHQEDTSEFVQWEAREGVIFNNIAVIPTKDDLEQVIAYELGHAKYKKAESHQAIRYLGYSAKTHFRSEITKIKEQVGEDHPLDPNVKIIYYKVQEQCADEIEPGIVRITKFNGAVPLARDFSGNLIPLIRTRFVYRLVPLGKYLHGRWTRTAPPLKVPKVVEKRLPWDTIGWETRFLNQ